MKDLRKIRPIKIGFALACILLVVGCASLATKSQLAPEKPGNLIGYLTVEEVPNSLALIPPPPAEGSAALALDEAVSQNSRTLRGTARWDLATEDANLKFPQAAATFSCALNASITEQDTPRLITLLRRSEEDAHHSTYAAKNHYKRTRPFVVNKEPTCTPNDEKHLRNSGSYPSGHTAIGWAWALILSEVAPEKTDAILSRGQAFGQSRVLCNVHWQSDVIEGRLMGAATVARLHSDPEFRADMVAAKAELAAVWAKGSKPVRDCEAEAKALALYPTAAPWPANR